MAGGEVSPVSSVRGARVRQTKSRVHRGTRGRKGVAAMPLRWPGTAASAVATMAGDHGSRSSRPRLEKPRKKKIEVPGDRGMPGGSHRGEEGGRRSTAVTVRAKAGDGFPATFGAAVVASSRAGEQNNGAWRQQRGASGPNVRKGRR